LRLFQGTGGVPDKAPDGCGPGCAQCGRPGGNEVAFGDGPSIWLHRECEVAFIDRRMREEGI
jgi:hypothetical protein